MTYGLLAAVGAQGESWSTLVASGGTETTYVDSGKCTLSTARALSRFPMLEQVLTLATSNT